MDKARSVEFKNASSKSTTSSLTKITDAKGGRNQPHKPFEFEQPHWL